MLFPCCPLDGRPWRKCRLSNNRLSRVAPTPFPKLGVVVGVVLPSLRRRRPKSTARATATSVSTNNKMGWDLFKSSRSKISDVIVKIITISATCSNIKKPNRIPHPNGSLGHCHPMRAFSVRFLLETPQPRKILFIPPILLLLRCSLFVQSAVKSILFCSHYRF